MLFQKGDNTGSTFFRIPFLLSASNGTLIAGTDANYGSTGDSAENIDVAIRTKDKGTSFPAYEGWNEVLLPSALHMYDYADEPGTKPGSASFIDGVILEDEVYSHRIMIAVDAYPWNGGLFSGQEVNAEGLSVKKERRTVAIGDGFCTIDGKKYLLLSSYNEKCGGLNNNVDRSRFDYVADIYGERDIYGRYRIYRLNGVPGAYRSDGGSVDDSHLSLGGISEYSLNVDYELFRDGEPLFVNQLSSGGADSMECVSNGKKVPAKIFYEASPLQMYNTTYIMLVYSGDFGKTWHTDKLLTGMVKREDSEYYITGPGRGIQLKIGPRAGRLIVPVYFGKNGQMYTEVIYSDDGGKTWDHGESVPVAAGGESAVVELPNGSLQIFIRNNGTGGKVLTAISRDYGLSWGAVTSALGDFEEGVNCQISAIGYSGKIWSKKDGRDYPAIFMSTPFNKNRTDGRVFIGLLKSVGTNSDGSEKYSIDWEYEYRITGKDSLFAYSCLTELRNGRIAILYESSETSSWADGLKGMYFTLVPLPQPF